MHLLRRGTCRRQQKKAPLPSGLTCWGYRYGPSEGSWERKRWNDPDFPLRLSQQRRSLRFEHLMFREVGYTACGSVSSEHLQASYI